MWSEELRSSPLPHCMFHPWSFAAWCSALHTSLPKQADVLWDGWYPPSPSRQRTPSACTTRIPQCADMVIVPARGCPVVAGSCSLSMFAHRSLRIVCNLCSSKAVNRKAILSAVLVVGHYAVSATMHKYARPVVEWRIGGPPTVRADALRHEHKVRCRAIATTHASPGSAY